MTRYYKGRTIDKNMDGKWVVTHKNGSHSQHDTLKGAKECIAWTVVAEGLEQES